MRGLGPNERQAENSQLGGENHWYVGGSRLPMWPPMRVV